MHSFENIELIPISKIWESIIILHETEGGRLFCCRHCKHCLQPLEAERVYDELWMCNVSLFWLHDAGPIRLQEDWCSTKNMIL